MSSRNGVIWNKIENIILSLQWFERRGSKFWEESCAALVRRTGSSVRTRVYDHAAEQVISCGLKSSSCYDGGHCHKYCQDFARGYQAHLYWVRKTLSVSICQTLMSVQMYTAEVQYYSFKAYWLCDAPTGLTFNNCTLRPHCIYVFCIYLRTNSDLCHLQHKLIGFYNRD